MSVSHAPGRESDASLPTSAGRDLRRAWGAVALVPVGFAAAMILGEWVIGLLGYPSGGNRVAPLGTAALVGVPATLIGILPGAAAAVYGIRARRTGLPGGLLPVLIGALVVLYLVVVTVVGLAGLA